MTFLMHTSVSASSRTKLCFSTQPLLSSMKKILENLLVALLAKQIWPIVDHSVPSNLHFHVTLKLIAFNLTCNRITNSALCIALETELPKIIITGTNLTEIPGKFRIFRDVRFSAEYEASLPPIGALRLSPHAETALIDLQHPSIPDVLTKRPELMQINSDFKALQFRSKIQFPYNMNPQRVHHIFVGTQAELGATFRLHSIKVLQYKMGIVVGSSNTQGFGGIMVEKYLENSRESTFVHTSSENLMTSYQDRFGLLRNRRFDVQSYPTPYHIMYNEQGQGNPVAGLTYKIMKSQADYFNFTFEYKTEGWHNIGQNPNGSWSGFVDNLIEDRIDVAMWLNPEQERDPFCEVPVVVFYETYGILKPIPVAESVQWYAMLYLFKLEVWLCIGISCVVVTPLFFAYHSKEHRTRRWNNLYFSLAAPVRMYLRQPAGLPNKAKLSSAIFLFGCIVVGIFFDSNLISFLTLPEHTHVPSTAEELAHAEKYSIEQVDYQGTTSQAYLRETNRPAVREIFPRLIKRAPWDTTEVLMRTATEPQTIALNYQKTSIAAVAANLTLYPGIYPVEQGEALLGTLVGPAFRKYSKLLDPLRINIGAMGQTGHFIKWEKEALELSRRRGSAWLKKERTALYRQLKTMAFNTLYPSVQPLTLQHFTLAFLCLSFGSIFAVLAFGGEFGVAHFPAKMLSTTG